jgi:hypothetical protein
MSRNPKFIINARSDDIYVRNLYKNGEIVIWAKLEGNQYIVQLQ